MKLKSKLKSESRILSLTCKLTGDGDYILVGLVQRGSSFDGLIVSHSKAPYMLFKSIVNSKFYDELRLIVAMGDIDVEALYVNVGKPVIMLNNDFQILKYYGVNGEVVYDAYLKFLRMDGITILKFLQNLTSEVEKIINTLKRH